MRTQRRRDGAATSSVAVNLTSAPLSPDLPADGPVGIAGLEAARLSEWIRSPTVVVPNGPSFRQLQHPVVEVRRVSLGPAQSLHQASHPGGRLRVVHERRVAVGDLLEVVCMSHSSTMKASGSG
jgi:hypothetical protein